ncbi:MULTISPECIES: 8-oxoguanine deaminase [unclassified Solwaraspora]|uniref:8-oxoguanine deaminase n=1 Tax=unclassified Solwaraspora TaxID=2627926 RepID=UPI00259B7E7E|nr:8-oxoguanine deaminase [Solwaraspora sp. WMMA2056]WJK38769.1 8-oxoguanine deaminase [Solwaraspora sp. WMMA2056]
MLAITGAAIATVDAAGTEHRTGHLVVGDDGRIAAVGPGDLPDDLLARLTGGDPGRVRRIDGTGCLATPGLVNTHHHLYQWATRGLAQSDDLFGWLTTLYPIWSRIDTDTVHDAAAANLGWLALSGCTTSTDHHYVFPRDGGDLFAAEIAAAARIGLRFHPCRGSMDLGRSAGGLPPDSVVEDTDAALAATEAAIDRWHDPSPESMLRVAVAPCSPFSVTPRLMRESAELARRRGVRLHTHLAETVEEEQYCQATHGCTPVQYADDLGWLGDDVWLAHGVHLDDAAVARLGATGTGVAHCPSSNARLGAGTARVTDLLAAGVPVGLGVDGAASQEAGHLGEELRQALYAARLRGGPAAMTARDALALGTIGGARCLGRDADIGSLQVGKLADVALWRLDGLGHAGIDDPVAALVLGPPAPVQLLLVGGRPVVEGAELRTADTADLAARAAHAHRVLTTSARPEQE